MGGPRRTKSAPLPHPVSSQIQPTATRGRFSRGARLLRAFPAWPAESAAPAAVRARDLTFRVALVLADVGAGILVALLEPMILAPDEPGLAPLVMLAFIPFVATATGLYKRDELLLSRSTLDEAPAVFQAATLVTVLAFLVQSAVLRPGLGAHVMLFIWLGLTVSMLALRAVARGLVLLTTAPERCLVIGDADTARRLEAKLLSTPSVHAVLLGRLWSGPERDGDGPPLIGTPEDLAAVVAARDVHRAIIAGDDRSPDELLMQITAAKALGVRVSLLPRMLEVVGSSVAFDELGGYTVLGVRRFGLSRGSRVVKRAFDLAGATIVVTLLGPLMLAIALAVRLTSAGPVLFRQTRVGRGGKPFQMLKFRSMHDGADMRRRELEALNEADGLFKIADDPRVTSFGRLLRRTSLDELPQLLNVLRGEMSLVGPRPLVAEDDRRVQGWHRRRLQLTPGMTGHWQVLGSARIPLRDMVTIDYLYVANWSLWADTKILLRTLPCVVLRRGL
jgi:exopolysaccharide biosynthesis polyprenyl glycosylphosphotransferase